MVVVHQKLVLASPAIQNFRVLRERNYSIQLLAMYGVRTGTLKARRQRRRVRLHLHFTVYVI